MSLPSGSIHSWEQLQRKFVEEYYSQFKAAAESSRYSGETHGSAPVANNNVQNGLEEIQEWKKIVDQLMAQNTQLMELNMRQGRTISELREQLSQTASAVSEMRDTQGYFPLQSIQPPTSNVSAMMIERVEVFNDEDYVEEKSKENNEESVSMDVIETSAAKIKETSAIFTVRDFHIIQFNPLFLETNPLQVPMEMIDTEADQGIWELFSKVEAGEQGYFEKRKRPSKKKRSSKSKKAHYYNTEYKKQVAKSSPKIVFGQVYHLPVKVKCNAFWIAKSNNFILTNVGIERELKLSLLKELRPKVNEKHQDYKARAQRFYERFGRSKRSGKFFLHLWSSFGILTCDSFISLFFIIEFFLVGDRGRLIDSSLGKVLVRKPCNRLFILGSKLSVKSAPVGR